METAVFSGLSLRSACGLPERWLVGTWRLGLARERGRGLVQAEECGYLVLGLPGTAGPPPSPPPPPATDLAFSSPLVWGPLHFHFHLHPHPGTVGNSSRKWVKALAVELSPFLLLPLPLSGKTCGIGHSED